MTDTELDKHIRYNVFNKNMNMLIIALKHLDVPIKKRGHNVGVIYSNFCSGANFSVTRNIRACITTSIDKIYD